MYHGVVLFFDRQFGLSLSSGNKIFIDILEQHLGLVYELPNHDHVETKFPLVDGQKVLHDANYRLVD
jgi:hypothetical protein